VWIKKASGSEPLMTCRNDLVGIETGPCADAPREAVHDVAARRRLDRGGAVIGGELFTAGETVNVADMAHHGRGDDRTDAVEVGEGGFGGATMG
jgi:hypothetical protein